MPTKEAHLSSTAEDALRKLSTSFYVLVPKFRRSEEALCARRIAWRTNKKTLPNLRFSMHYLPVSIPSHLVNPHPFRIQQFQFQRHLAQRMGGAGQTGVIGADGDFQMVEQPLGQFLAVQIAMATARTASFIA